MRRYPGHEGISGATRVSGVSEGYPGVSEGYPGM